MSISTALLYVLTLSVLALVVALWAVWRRLKELSDQVSALPGKPSPANAPTPQGHVEPVARFPLITDTAARGASPPRTAASESRDPDLTAARVASVTLAEPLIKVAAFTSGVRRALGEEHRIRVSATFRRELRRQRKLRRRQRASRAHNEEVRP